MRLQADRFNSPLCEQLIKLMRDVQSLSLREQVEVARYVQRLSESARRKRATVLRETHGSLDDADGRAFEEALAESRKWRRMAERFNGILLDTSVVVAHLRGSIDLQALASADEPLFLPLVALGELYRGVLKSVRPESSRAKVVNFYS